METMARNIDNIKQGYLIKSPDLDKYCKGPKATFKSNKNTDKKTWKKRWFVFRNVQENPTLYYYADQKTYQKEKKRPNGIIELTKCEALEEKPEVELQKHRYENVICITVSSSPKKPHSKRLYYLMADTRADMEDWYRILKKVLVELNLMEPVEGDGLVRSNTNSMMKPRHQQTRRQYHSAPTGTLEDLKRTSIASNDSSDSCGSQQSDTANANTTLVTENSPDRENKIVDLDDEERIKCCQKRHVIHYDNTGCNMADYDVIYENVHFIRNQLHWEKDVMQRKEKIVQVEENYQDFSAIKTLQNENVFEDEEQAKYEKLTKPAPPPRGDSLLDQPKETETDTSASQTQSEVAQKPRRRKISRQMLNHTNLSPEELQILVPENESPHSPKERQRRTGMSSMEAPRGLQDTRPYSGHSESYFTSASEYLHGGNTSDPSDPHDNIPPVPLQVQNAPRRVRKLSRQELISRPLPNPEESTGTQEQTPTTSSRNLTARTRKMSHQELANRPLPNPNGNQPRRKLSVDMTAGYVPSNGMTGGNSWEVGSTYMTHHPDHDMPSRPPPPPPPVRKSQTDYETMSSTQEAILINPCQVNYTPRNRRSRSGSMPNLLDDDDFKVFRELHPEVQAMIPEHPSSTTDPHLYTQDPNDFKPKIPESTRSKREKKISLDSLDSEMKQSEGITRTILREHLADKSVAFVGISNSVWVAGWKSDIQKLQNVFHIGDQILSINDMAVKSVVETHNAIEQSGTVVKVQFRRLPLGQMFAMNRQSFEEDWGIRVKGLRTGISVHSEIDVVLIGGIAYNSGLKNKCRSIFDRLSSWAITEINFEPLSLFSTAVKVKKQLQDAGLDLVILVQPSDFIRELKRQLQETKNWIPEILQAPKFVVPDE